MIHYAETAGTLYFYPASAGSNAFEERRKHAGVCTVVWLWEGAVYLKALRADMDRTMQRELVGWLMGRGIRMASAEREPGRWLPMARRVDDHLEIDVAELARRIGGQAAPADRRAGDPAPPPPGRRTVRPSPPADSPT